MVRVGMHQAKSQLPILSISRRAARRSSFSVTVVPSPGSSRCSAAAPSPRHSGRFAMRSSWPKTSTSYRPTSPSTSTAPAARHRRDDAAGRGPTRLEGAAPPSPMAVHPCSSVPFPLGGGHQELARQAARSRRPGSWTSSRSASGDHRSPCLGGARPPAESPRPFDRLLVAQAVCKRATLVSTDPIFDPYATTRIW